MFEAFQFAGAEIFDFKSMARQPAGAICDQDLPWLGQALKARREVGRLASHLASVERAASGEIAYHHAASRDADARSKRRACRRPETFNLPDRLEAGPDRAFSVVLIRHRPAEVGEHAVAEKLCDIAVEPFDGARDGFLVGAYEVVHLLRFEPNR